MSKWVYRVDRRAGDKAHGITFCMHERNGPGVEGELARGNAKLTLPGRASLTLALGQTRYGDQLIAQVYTQEAGTIEPRQSDSYNRVQIYFGAADLSTAEMLERVASEIRLRDMLAGLLT